MCAVMNESNGVQWHVMVKATMASTTFPASGRTSMQEVALPVQGRTALYDDGAKKMQYPTAPTAARSSDPRLAESEERPVGRGFLSRRSYNAWLSRCSEALYRSSIVPARPLPSYPLLTPPIIGHMHFTPPS